MEIKFLLGLIYLCFFMALLSFLSGIDDEFCQMFRLYLLRYYFLFITLVKKSMSSVYLSIYLSITHLEHLAVTVSPKIYMLKP